jgi:hypothetical protein
MRHIYLTTLEELNESAVDVAVEVEITPGDPGYRYNRNGDGCPPSPTMAELVSATVQTVYGEYITLQRNQLSILHVKRWDARAFNRLEEIWHNGESDRALESASEAAQDDRY